MKILPYPAINSMVRFGSGEDNEQPSEPQLVAHLSEGEITDCLLDMYLLGKVLGFPIQAPRVQMAKSLDDPQKVRAEIARVPHTMTITLSVPMDRDDIENDPEVSAVAFKNRLAAVLELHPDQLSLINVMTARVSSSEFRMMLKPLDQPASEAKIFNLSAPSDCEAFSSQGLAVLLRYLDKHPLQPGIYDFITVNIAPRTSSAEK